MWNSYLSRFSILTEEFGLDWMGIRGRFVGRNVYSLNDWESRLGRISEAEAGISRGIKRGRRS